ncbi:MAG: AfsR/SARP family transcriptional regulator, partial [Acidimicrobiales bacterium]
MEDKRVRVRLLGAFEVEGVPERDLGSRKGRLLLKVLAAARGAPVPVDLLAEVLWGDDQPARPADQVGVLVSRLRGVLGAHRIPRSDAGYSLVADWTDVAALVELSAAAAEALDAGRVGAARAAADAALALARGPLLADEDGLWVEADRAAVQASVTRLRRLAVDAAVTAGDPGGAAALAEQALAADPYDEAVLRALMNAHLAAGRPASALAAYARVRERLAEDLGVPPTAETEALHADTLAAADGDAAGPLPAPPAPS